MTEMHTGRPVRRVPEPASAAVTYVGLPVSSGGGHSLGRMSRPAAYEKTREFLRTCTQPVAPISFAFAVYTRFELPPVPTLERELGRRFGSYDSIPEDRVPEALALLDEIDPQPANPYGMVPIWFRMRSAFRILDRETKSPLPGQDPSRFGGVDYAEGVPLGSSGLALSLHSSAVLSMNLCIPEASDRLLRSLIPWLQDNLPCKLSPKHWRAWTPTRTAPSKAESSRRLIGVRAYASSRDIHQR
jgi:hypothetical protein